MINNELLAIVNDEGVQIDAHFSVVLEGGAVTVVIESKGGGISSPNKRNTDYNDGFQLLLERLALKSAIIDEVVVDSKSTQASNLSRQERRLQLRGRHQYPIALSSIRNFSQLRTVLCAAQKPIGQQPGAIGGNGQRRIRLYVHLEARHLNLETLGRELATPQFWDRFSEIELKNAANEENDDGTFDPKDVEDARTRKLAAIVQRQGQPRFRKDLIEAYDGKCAITGCNSLEVLEAAHICPYMGEATNSVRNGLLLRSDIHTLFDRGLIAIDTSDWTVLVDSQLESTEYVKFRGQPLKCPANDQFWPNVIALNFHKKSSRL